MRMAAPVVGSFNMVQDAVKFSRNQQAIVGAQYNQAMIGRAGQGMFHQMGEGIGNDIRGAAGGMFHNLLGAVKSSFIISALLSGVSNLYELCTGKTKPGQALGNFVADTAAYTGIGAVSTTIGGLIGTLIPIPFLGTALGIAVGSGIGLLLGKLYEDNLRKSLSGTIAQGVESLGHGSTPAPATQTPAPTH